MGQFQGHKPQPGPLAAVFFDPGVVFRDGGFHGGDVIAGAGGLSRQLFGKTAFAAVVWARNQDQLTHTFSSFFQGVKASPWRIWSR